MDSRLASVRILGPPDLEDYATRFEVRIPGADVNVPLAFSAIFALGMYGIENKLELPFPPLGHAASKDAPKVVLPATLEAATRRFMAPESMARKVLPTALVDHVAATRLHEVNQFHQAVTNWELERYMELI